MGQPGGVCFEPDTIELLRKVLDEAWDVLSPSRQQTVLKTELAERILAAAGLGERDPDRLRAIALMRPARAVGSGSTEPGFHHSSERALKDF